jgi:hypothetical protein
LLDGLLKCGGKAAVQGAPRLRPVTELLGELSGFHSVASLQSNIGMI